MRILYLLTLFLLLSGCGENTSAQKHASLASTHMNAGKFELAYQESSRAVELKPNVPEFLIFKGMSAVKTNKIEIAKSSYEKALSIYQKQEETGLFCRKCVSSSDQLKLGFVTGVDF